MKAIINFILTAVFLYSGTLLSQHNALYFHRTFQGTINGTLEVEVDLTCEDTLLTGWYRYRPKGNWITLEGKTIVGHEPGVTKFFLEEFSDGKITGTWVGEISHGGKVEGKWMASTGKTQLDISLKDLHSELSVVFEKYKHQATRVIAEINDVQKVAEATHSVLWPIGGLDTKKIEILQRDIIEIQFGKEIGIVHYPLGALKRTAERFIAEVAGNYAENAAADYPNMMDEYENRSMNVILNEKGILSLGFIMVGYTGGAHPYSSSRFFVWDMNEMKILKWDDIFIPQALDSLRRRINEDAMVNGAADIFIVNEIDPLEADLVVEADGVRFFYDVDEVTPYVLGSWDLFYNWEELLPLIKPDSPVQRLTFNSNGIR